MDLLVMLLLLLHVMQMWLLPVLWLDLLLWVVCTYASCTSALASATYCLLSRPCRENQSLLACSHANSTNKAQRSMRTTETVLLLAYVNCELDI